MDKSLGWAGNAALEQFLLLSQSSKGSAAAGLIKDVLEAPGIYVFGELLDMPNIRDLANGPYSYYLHLLMIFAYGKLNDYRVNQNRLPPLTQSQLMKLRHLTIVSLAMKLKCLPYNMLLTELDVKNRRELEDVIIEGIYADVYRGKLDQQHDQLQVLGTVYRDVAPDQLSHTARILEEWSKTCEELLQFMKELIQRADETKSRESTMKTTIERQVDDLRKAIQAYQTGKDGADVGTETTLARKVVTSEPIDSSFRVTPAS